MKSTILIEQWRQPATAYLSAIMAGHCKPAAFACYLQQMDTPAFMAEWRAIMLPATEPSEPYRIVDGNISVCGYCYPGNTITALFPDLDGTKISHTICEAHKSRFVVELKFLKVTTKPEAIAA
jgi:hypothetical protein